LVARRCTNILLSWHERQIADHLAQLAQVRDGTLEGSKRLEAVLETFALISHAQLGVELAALLHGGDHVVHAQQRLTDLVQGLLTEGAKGGYVRDDVAPSELAHYCLHALTAARGLPSKAAVRRLVEVTLAGLRPHADPVR
jgi:hypothetical protein